MSQDAGPEDWLAVCRNKLRRSIQEGKHSQEAVEALVKMEEMGRSDDTLKYEIKRWAAALSYIKIINELDKEKDNDEPK